MSYKLTRRSERDIENVRSWGAARFGLAQADRYLAGLRATLDLLAANPRLARERSELRRPVRLHPYQSHLIVYVEQETGILVVRILHGKQDVLRHLGV